MAERRSKKVQNESSATEDEKVSIMDSLISNPGLAHVADKIFGYLRNGTLLSCLLVSKEWNTFLTEGSSVVKISKSIPSFLGVYHTRATVITTGLDCMDV